MSEENTTVEQHTETYKVTVKIPFPSQRQAEIAYDVLRIDEEPKRSFITKTITLEENVLKVELNGQLAKNVRVGLNSFFDSVILCCETLNEFGPPADSYNFY